MTQQSQSHRLKEIIKINNINVGSQRLIKKDLFLISFQFKTIFMKKLLGWKFKNSANEIVNVTKQWNI